MCHLAFEPLSKCRTELEYERLLLKYHCCSLFSVLLESQEISQTVERATVAQEIMSQQLVGRSATLDVNTQADGQESLELLAEFLRLLESRSSICCDEVQGLQGLLVEVWRLRLYHFDSHNAQRPDINLRTVFFLLDNLGGHPIGGSHHGGSLGLCLCKLGAEAKISNFDVSTSVQ
jgi:hypothetical protein